MQLTVKEEGIMEDDEEEFLSAEECHEEESDPEEYTKVTIPMDIEEEGIIVTPIILLPPPPVEIDLTPFSSLISKLESSSGQKHLKIILNNFKEVCKLISILPPASPISTDLLQKVKKYCAKCIDCEEKEEKFFRKCDDQLFSCEGELFKTFLKYGMKNSKNGEGGWVLISILESFYKVAAAHGKISSPILGIQMLLSHSKAEDIFLEFHKLKRPPIITPRKGEGKEGEEFPDKVEKPSTRFIYHLDFSSIKTQLMKLWLVLAKSFCKIGKLHGTENDKKILENSVPYLMQMYAATLGQSDLVIFSILKLYSNKKLQIPLESMPLFGPKCFDSSITKDSPLYAHSIRANTVLGSINEKKALETGLKFEEEKFLSEKVLEESPELGQYYDLRFLIPLVCHVLDEKNICDAVKVLSNGWIYIIARGLCINDPALRNSAFLAFKRLIFNLHLAKGSRLQDVKIWLHFLLGVKNGFVTLEECRLTPLLATWMVATCEVLKHPNHILYSKVTHFLLAKPIIDLTILPDFTHFFNSEDGNKETREWILNILLQGLQSKEDWTIAKKVPTIKYMCSLFSLEKIQTQRTILNILANGAKIPEVAHDMVDRHGLLLWIANVKIDEKTFYRRELQDIYKNLSLFCPQGEYRDSVFHFVAKKHSWEYIRQDFVNTNNTNLGEDTTC